MTLLLSIAAGGAAWCASATVVGLTFGAIAADRRSTRARAGMVDRIGRAHEHGIDTGIALTVAFNPESLTFGELVDIAGGAYHPSVTAAADRELNRREVAAS